MAKKRDTTERKKAEETRERERDLLRTLIDNLPDSIYLKDTKSRFIAANARLASVMGVKTPDELIGKTDFDFYPNELAEQYYADDQEIISSGKPRLSSEEPFMDLATGRKGWIATAKVPLRDREGNVTGLVGIGRDITERKRAAEEYAAILSTTVDSFWITDAQGRFLDVNDAYCRLIGYSRDELLTMSIRDVVERESPEETAERLRRVAKTGMELFESQHRCKDGKVVDLEVRISYSETRGGRGYVFARDITERKKAEEALERERNLLRTLIDNLPDSIYLKDTKSRFITANARLASIMGVKTPDELIGKTDFDFYPKELAEQYYADEQEIIGSGKPRLSSEEPLMDLATGRKGWLATAKVPLRDREGNVMGLVGIGRDITERKKAEEEIKQRIVELATLNEIGRAIASAMELDRLWELLYEQTRRVMDTPAFYISIYDRKRKELRYVIDMLDGKHRSETELPRTLGKGRTDYIIRKNKPLLIQGDAQEAYRGLGIIPSDDKAKAFAGVPIVVGSKVTGVLAVQHYERDDAYNAHTIEVLSVIASQAGIAIENAQLFQAERKKAAQLSVISEVGKEASSILDLDEMLKEVVHSIRSSFNYYNVSIFLVDKDRNDLVMRAIGGAFEGSFSGEYRQSLDVGVIGWVAKTGKSRLANDVTKDPYYYKGPVEDLLTNSELGVPLKLGNETIGVLSIQSADLNAFDEADVAAMETLGGQIAVAIENARLFGETKRLATTDPLTGAWNRRHLEERLHTEVARARRFRRHLSVLVMDIDNLKLFNDTYGHITGDEVIHTIAQAVLASCREIDVVGRYGGDEFAIILPETDAPGAAKVAERIITGLEKTHFPAPNGTKLPLSVSIGTASYPSDSDKAERLFSLADAAMYRAKIAGGGQFASLTITPGGTAEEIAAPFDVLMGLLLAVDNKDHYTFKHSQDVSRRACALARAMHVSSQDLGTLEVVGKLHDVGKIGIPTNILRKPGPLTQDERKVIQEHPRLGYMILQQLPQMDLVLQALLYHHERYDGEGYPTGLHGEQIPLFARIMALADAYSAMRTDRPYRKALTTEEALEEVKRNFGKQFDPELAQKFVELIEKGEID